MYRHLGLAAVIGPKIKTGRLLAMLLVASMLVLLGACTTQTGPQRESPAGRRTSTPESPSPTLADFWRGDAKFTVETLDTGLPMGESETVVLPDGTLRSYVHASHQSLGVVDQCGEPAPFPGCVVTFASSDQGQTFSPPSGATEATCQIPCARCPCDSRRDHVDQQQYPRIARLSSVQNRSRTGTQTADRALLASTPDWVMVYEYRANIILRRSVDGLSWSEPAELPRTGIWESWLMPCPPAGNIGSHPHAAPRYDCLIGSPPGLFVDNTAPSPELYVFIGMGQNPGSMACYRGSALAAAPLLRACDHTPLFVGSSTYGPTRTSDAPANGHFDFRTISSAEVVRIDRRFYMLYEGVRGPTAGAAGDTQFLLGLARSRTSNLDGPWEKYPHNPILLDLPGNVGVGHSDLVRMDGSTYLYTSLDGETRSRLELVWKQGAGEKSGTN